MPFKQKVEESSSSRILFVCTANIQRSLTAEHLFSSLYPHILFKSAGVSLRECGRNSSKLCTVDLLDWASNIFVFEQMHIDRIVEHTGKKFTHKIYNLEIDDCYQYMQQELIEKLQAKLKHYV